jgi:hypothetical protein
MILIVIAVLQGVTTSGMNVLGMAMLLQFVVSFGFILVRGNARWQAVTKRRATMPSSSRPRHP